MRTPALLLLALLAGCAAPDLAAPSLAPRTAESIDPRVPVPGPNLATAPNPQLIARLDSLIAQARSGDLAFRAAADEARRMVAVAGPRESESWVVAQQALSVAVAARAPVVRAISDIDALGADSIEAHGGIGAANLQAILAAAAEVAEIDEREASVIDQLQAALPG